MSFQRYRIIFILIFMVFGCFGDQGPEHRMINDMENAQSGKCSHLFSFVSHESKWIKSKMLLKIAVTIQLRFYKTFSVRRRFSLPSFSDSVTVRFSFFSAIVFVTRRWMTMIMTPLSSAQSILLSFSNVPEVRERERKISWIFKEFFRWRFFSGESTGRGMCLKSFFE